jgi:hypothetical protein
MWDFLKGVLTTPQALAGVIAALVAATASILVTIWNPLAARQLERHKAKLQDELEARKTQFQVMLETKKSELVEAAAARNARLDYEYEARKRLYEEIEPLLFQLHEAAEEAFYRVGSLARTSRNGELEWLTREGYYMKSTIHRLLLPAAILRIIQRRMTFVDMHVDETIRTKYHLLKMYAWSFTDDFDFRYLMRLPYKPDEATAKLLKEEPAVYWRQGLYTGTLEKAVDAMLTHEANNLRPMTFGEFEAALDPKAPSRPNLQPLVDLYFRFEPSTRPILATMLHAQGCIAGLLLLSYREVPREGLLSGGLTDFINSPDFVQDFRWSKDAPADDGDRMQSYISGKFSRISGREWKSA